MTKIFEEPKLLWNSLSQIEHVKDGDPHPASLWVGLTMADIAIHTYRLDVAGAKVTMVLHHNITNDQWFWSVQAKRFLSIHFLKRMSLLFNRVGHSVQSVFKKHDKGISTRRFDQNAYDDINWSEGVNSAIYKAFADVGIWFPSISKVSVRFVKSPNGADYTVEEYELPLGFGPAPDGVSPVC